VAKTEAHKTSFASCLNEAGIVEIKKSIAVHFSELAKENIT
jgi:hypothetical protein